MTEWISNANASRKGVIKAIENVVLQCFFHFTAERRDTIELICKNVAIPARTTGE